MSTVPKRIRGRRPRSFGGRLDGVRVPFEVAHARGQGRVVSGIFARRGGLQLVVVARRVVESRIGVDVAPPRPAALDVAMPDLGEVPRARAVNRMVSPDPKPFMALLLEPVTGCSQRRYSNLSNVTF